MVFLADLVIEPAAELSGEVALPGDKSISHRALMIAALADGDSVLEGVQTGADCAATRRALAASGVAFIEHDGRITVRGRGPAGLRPAAGVIDCGNSGTTMRLLAGIFAGCQFETVLGGDDSLCRRPMARVIEPLTRMGARIEAGESGLPPLRVAGGALSGIEYRLPVASAQVKSAVILAGLLARGETTVVEPYPTRDHTERMLAGFGANIRVSGPRITVNGGGFLHGRTVGVPGDFSAAAFFLAAAAVVPDSRLRLPGVGVNPTRTAFLDVVRRMGLDVEITGYREECGEPVGDLLVSGGNALAGVSVSGALIPNLIDELPLLAVLGLFAHGRTEVSDAGELRVKESDRIAAIVGGLRLMGAVIAEKDDGFALEGPQRLKGARVSARGDHRIAMSLAVAALGARGQTTIEGAECIPVSFPGFAKTLGALAREKGMG